MTKILENNKAMAEATKAMIADHSKAEDAKTQYATSAMSSLIYMIAFLLDFGASNNKATKAYEAALEAEDVIVTNDKASGYVASYKRQRPIAKHAKVKALVKDATTIDGIQNALTEAGMTSIGKLQALTAPPLAKLTVKARSAVDAMMATSEVQTLIAGLDEDQQSAFERSIENSCRNVDAALKNATHAETMANTVASKAKRELAAKMASEKQTAVAS